MMTTLVFNELTQQLKLVKQHYQELVLKSSKNNVVAVLKKLPFLGSLLVFFAVGKKIS